jgi:hypothetical protein
VLAFDEKAPGIVPVPPYRQSRPFISQESPQRTCIYRTGIDAVAFKPLAEVTD